MCYRNAKLKLKSNIEQFHEWFKVIMLKRSVTFLDLETEHGILLIFMPLG